MHCIRPDDEVFVRFDDGKFYFGTVKEIRKDSVLTHFEDGTEKWAPASEITKLSVKSVGSMCVVCKEYDEIVQICSQCQRGFHKKCIKPSTSDEWTNDSLCHRCSILSKPNEIATHSRSVATTPNTQTSCYCGEKGYWGNQMLQCVRCLQWFHSKCIKCLNFPLYFGDRYDHLLIISIAVYILSP